MDEIRRVATHIKQTMSLYTKKSRIRLITNSDGSYAISIEIPAGTFPKPDSAGNRIEEV